MTEVFFKEFLLNFDSGILVVVVEAGFADCHRSRNEFQNAIAFDAPLLSVVRMQTDGGDHWCAPGVLCSLDNAFDGGYPACVLLEDETIVTAYYASGVAEHARYHMGVVRWTFDEAFARNRPAPDTF